MILSILLGLVVVFLAFGFYKANGLRTIEIVKTVNISAPQQEVYGLITTFKRYPEWSPFLQQDPGQAYSVKGEDGTIGVQYHWAGNKGKDQGYQEITALEPGRQVSIRCHIQKPFTAKPDFNYVLTNGGKNVLVTQTFVLKSGLGDAFFLWLFGVKKEMEATNALGLGLLKKAAEKQVARN